MMDSGRPGSPAAVVASLAAEFYQPSRTADAVEGSGESDGPQQPQLEASTLVNRLAALEAKLRKEVGCPVVKAFLSNSTRCKFWFIWEGGQPSLVIFFVAPMTAVTVLTHCGCARGAVSGATWFRSCSWRKRQNRPGAGAKPDRELRRVFL